MEPVPENRSIIRSLFGTWGPDVGIAFEDVETGAGGYWVLIEGVRGVVWFGLFPIVGCESVLGIPAMILHFSTDLLRGRSQPLVPSFWVRGLSLKKILELVLSIVRDLKNTFFFRF